MKNNNNDVSDGDDDNTNNSDYRNLDSNKEKWTNKMDFFSIYF